MNIKPVVLPVVLSLSLFACDSDTVEVISVSADNSSSTNDNGTDGSTNTDNTDNGNTNDGNTDGNTNGGGNGVLSNPDRLISQVGLVKVEAVNTDNDFSRGLFTEMDTPLSAQEVLEFFVPESDLCEVSRYNAAFPPGGAFKIYDQEPTLISSGSNITLTSGADVYANLERQIVEGTGLVYRSNSALDENIPDNLVLNIPGEVFPGFANVALSNVPQLQVSAPTDTVTENTEFVWNANTDPLSVFEIYAGYNSPETNQVIEIGCTVIDDGQFSFSEATRGELGEGFTADWFSYLRVVYDVAESGDALLLVANSDD
ncbi:MAG: hypothetical protein AAF404_00975 [Pseudomonadota bacterium]